MEAIRQFLNTQPFNYQAGVQLYLQYGSNRALAACFTQESVTPFKQQRLRRALQELLQSSEPERYSPPPVRHSPVAHKGWPNPIESKVIQALWEQFRPLYTELMSLQHRSYEVALQAEKGDPNKKLEAAQIVHRILELDEQLDDIYAARDHYLQHGHLPGSYEEDAEPVGDPVRWATELQNTQRYVREYRAKIRNHPGHKNIPRWESKIEKFEADIARYRRLLKLDDE